MSTKALNRALEILEAHGKLDGSKDAIDAAAVAREELANIERAAKTWWMRDDVMERIEDAGHGGFDVVRSIAKDAP